MGRIVVLYVDGAFGIGKTTVLRQIQKSAAYRFRRIYLEEPMRAWRSWFVDDHDAIREIYTTQELKDAGEIDLREASRRVCYAQVSLSAPFHIMNAVIYGIISGESEATSAHLGEGDYFVGVDRHPLASCLCFPVARFVTGYLEYTDLIALVATLPDYPRGASIAILDLSVEEQARRITERSRSGEHVNKTFLRILRNVFIIMYNTVAYLRNVSIDKACADREALEDFRGSQLESDMHKIDIQPRDDPNASETLFAVMASDATWRKNRKQSALFVYTMAKLDALLRSLNMHIVDINGLSQEQCAEKVVAISSKVPAVTARGNAPDLLFDAVEAYNADMGV
ncbi:thymidine kinase [Psittacid alphaherpesvirus 1]|uniref:Thymidine kinase n=1 Tax=Psittacid herpesvirus 1 (isolate Amazon parrot/-/97-0001/1997) TaxID=670426 RepID=KITH_PSHV1|nr:thymidine kinase [Psittacid alphaherpesvirus 1]Q6UDK9.1 RecName: Full=Thymidine kinase [Psittacid herpesvirus 1 Amazon parrot/1997]AAQ73701.1 thymidine kinase [Psittacid alphaherpesvirus 1]